MCFSFYSSVPLRNKGGGGREVGAGRSGRCLSDLVEVVGDLVGAKEVPRLRLCLPSPSKSLQGVPRAGRRAYSPIGTGGPGQACLETPLAGARVHSLRVPARGSLVSPNRRVRGVPRLPLCRERTEEPSGPPAATCSWHGGLGTPYPSASGALPPATKSRVVPNLYDRVVDEVPGRAVPLPSCSRGSPGSCRTSAFVL